MKTSLAFAIALVLQTISAASVTDIDASLNQNESAEALTNPAIGDKMAQDLLEKFTIFRWEANNSFAKETFDFELNEPTRLQVIDFKHHGDMFDVYDNGELLGSSSKVVYDENVETYAATPQEALMDDHFSKGAFSLGKGKHSITIKAYGPYDVGSAALRLVQRTNLVLAKGKQADEEEEEEEASDDEEIEEAEAEKSASKKDVEYGSSDWQKKYLLIKKDKDDDRDKKDEYDDYDRHDRYDGYEKHDYEKHEHRKPDPPAPVVVTKTQTHFATVRQTAIPYATRVVYEKDSHYKGKGKKARYDDDDDDE